MKRNIFSLFMLITLSIGFSAMAQSPEQMFKAAGSPVNPQFAELYAPIDGFIFNGGVKVRL